MLWIQLHRTIKEDNENERLFGRSNHGKNWLHDWLILYKIRSRNFSDSGRSKNVYLFLYAYGPMQILICRYFLSNLLIGVVSLLEKKNINNSIRIWNISFLVNTFNPLKCNQLWRQDFLYLTDSTWIEEELTNLLYWTRKLKYKIVSLFQKWTMKLFMFLWKRKCSVVFLIMATSPLSSSVISVLHGTTFATVLS